MSFLILYGQDLREHFYTSIVSVCMVFISISWSFYAHCIFVISAKLTVSLQHFFLRYPMHAAQHPPGYSSTWHTCMHQWTWHSVFNCICVIQTYLVFQCRVNCNWMQSQSVIPNSIAALQQWMLSTSQMSFEFGGIRKTSFAHLAYKLFA